MPTGKIRIERNEFAIKAISKEELNTLLENGVLKNTHDGFVDGKSGETIGHYRTLGAARRMYIEDKYARIADKLYYGKSGDKRG